MSPVGPPRATPGSSASSFVIRASDVQSRRIRWAWNGWLAIGYLTVQTGVEGLGKSVFAAWMIARLTRGELEGEWRGTPIDVLIVAGEDGIADTWTPRLDLAGADLDRVAFLNLATLPPGWNLRDGINQLRETVTETQARVIFIDAALDHIPPPRGGESINDPVFVRQALAPLKQAVRELELVCLFSMHPPKARSADFRGLVQASQAFSAIPRVGLLLAYHPDDEPEDPERRRVLIRGKGNIGRNPGALEFRIASRPYRHDDGHTTEREVAAGVKPSVITIADLAPDKLMGARQPTKAERAVDIIREALADGQWHPAGPIRDALARQELNSESVVKRAGDLAGVEKRKRPGQSDGPWEWRLRTNDGDLESSPPAPARCLTDRGVFDLSGSIPSNNGKTPRLRNDARFEVGAGKTPLSNDLRARGDGGKSWAEDELDGLIRRSNEVDIEQPEIPSSLALDCWRPQQHAGREWRLAGGGPWCCSTCHPPVDELKVVWCNREQTRRDGSRRDGSP